MGERSGTGRMDLTGDRYGQLTVMGPAPDIGGKPAWRCKCDCGNEIDVRANNLRAGRTKSCGCLRSPRRELAGMKFGRLTVMGPAANIGRSTAWHCKCECGKEVVVRTASLVSGLTTSCGCLAAELHRESRADLAGQVFGKLTALEPAGKRGRDTVWRCRCECGNEAIVRTRDLRSGSVKSCGCLGGGPRRDLTGQVFGRLTVLEPAMTASGRPGWRCRCECGKEAVVTAGHLRSGWTRSCGCLRGSKKKDAGV